MERSVIIIGIGEMASVFARGFLRSGRRVIPVTRQMQIQEVAAQYSAPEFVLVGVAENDLHKVLEQIPAEWRDRLVLLQNELLPRDWEQYAFSNPTVISVWFEKKKGQDVKVLIPSPVYGPFAEPIHDSLATLDIPSNVLANTSELEHELVIKNVYILTTNIAGLVVGGNVNTLWSKHQELAREVANDVIDIQEHLTGKTFNRELLIDGMVKAMNGDPEHGCMGRSAPARLARAIAIADEANLGVIKLRDIAAKQ